MIPSIELERRAKPKGERPAAIRRDDLLVSQFNSEPVGEIPIGEKSVVKVSKFTGRDGRRRVDNRLFVAGERYTGPTRRGVALPVEKLEDLIALLQKAK